MKTPEILAIIPARYESLRLKGKPLINILGKPLIQHVWENVQGCQDLAKVIIATDHLEIFEAAQNFGAEVMMTSENHETGTDRLVEVVNRIEKNYSVIVNIQGDEPCVNHQLIKALLLPFFNHKTDVQISTLKKKITDNKEISNPNIVKVVTKKDKTAMYFSRHPIPYNRDNKTVSYYKHLGFYAYSRQLLLSIPRMQVSLIELNEKLEQLRIMDNGYDIHVEETAINTIDVNTAEDIQRATLALKALTN